MSSEQPVRGAYEPEYAFAMRVSEWAVERVKSLEGENERLREHSRRQAEQIVTLTDRVEGAARCQDQDREQAAAQTARMVHQAQEMLDLKIHNQQLQDSLKEQTANVRLALEANEHLKKQLEEDAAQINTLLKERSTLTEQLEQSKAQVRQLMESANVNNRKLEEMEQTVKGYEAVIDRRKKTLAYDLGTEVSFGPGFSLKGKVVAVNYDAAGLSYLLRYWEGTALMHATMPADEVEEEPPLEGTYSRPNGIGFAQT